MQLWFIACLPVFAVLVANLKLDHAKDLIGNTLYITQ
jgi:hypothetical protein